MKEQSLGSKVARWGALAAVGTASVGSAIVVPGGIFGGALAFCCVGVAGLGAYAMGLLTVQGKMTGGMGEAWREFLGEIFGRKPKGLTSSRSSNLALLSAAKLGQGERIERLLGEGADANCLRVEGVGLRCALELAVESGDLRSVKALAAQSNQRHREMSALAALQARRLDLSQAIERAGPKGALKRKGPR